MSDETREQLRQAWSDVQHQYDHGFELGPEISERWLGAILDAARAVVRDEHGELVAANAEHITMLADRLATVEARLDAEYVDELKNITLRREIDGLKARLRERVEALRADAEGRWLLASVAGTAPELWEVKAYDVVLALLSEGEPPLT